MNHRFFFARSSLPVFFARGLLVLLLMVTVSCSVPSVAGPEPPIAANSDFVPDNANNESQQPESANAAENEEETMEPDPPDEPIVEREGPESQEPSLDLYSLEGNVIAEETIAEPSGSFALAGYRIEELTLPHEIGVTVDNQVQQVDKAWRFTVNGGPFQVGALFYYVWLDDTLLGPAKEKADLSGIDVIVFDKSALRNGATISVSYGPNDTNRSSFPEALRMPADP